MMENPIQMDDLGGTPTIFGNIHVVSFKFNAPAEIPTFQVPSSYGFQSQLPKQWVSNQ